MNLTQIKNQKGIRNKIMGVVAGLNVFCMTSMLALATPSTGAGINGAFETVRKVILEPLNIALEGIVTPIAVICFIICLIMMLMSQNQKKVEAYRSWCINIFGCIVLIYAVPFFIDLAKSVGLAFS